MLPACTVNLEQQEIGIVAEFANVWFMNRNFKAFVTSGAIFLNYFVHFIPTAAPAGGAAFPPVWVDHGVFAICATSRKQCGGFRAVQELWLYRHTPIPNRASDCPFAQW